VETAHHRLAENQTARRAIEKDLAMSQGRLGKYKDQLMEVKTNREYQAMQLEIATSQGEVKRLEDQLLERMVEADDLAAAIKTADADLRTQRAQADAELKSLEAEETRLKGLLDQAAAKRATVAAALSAELLSQFDFIRAKRGSAVVEARDGHCSVCHVRLRPQIYNEIRSNEQITKCESCGRFLYYAPPKRAGATQTVAP
jgi:predicted  nucleic acid-binding Zn-ribbon protein